MVNTLVTAAVVLLLCVSQAMAAETPNDLTISLSAETGSVYRGEPLTITVSVNNASSKPVVVPVDWSEGRFTLTRTLDGGAAREWNPFAAPEGMDRTVTLQPGQAHRAVTDLLFVSNGAEPGVHKFKARLESDGWYLKLDRHSGQMVKRPCWAGRVESKPLSVTVKALADADDRKALAVLTRGRDVSEIWLYSDAVLAGTDKRYATVLKEHPKSVFAKHCELTLARVYARRFHQSGMHFDKAARHYTNVIGNYAAFAFAGDAMLALARVYLRKEQIDPNKGYRDKAIKHLRHLAKTCPKSDSAPAAKKLLAEVQKTLAPRQP